MPQSIFLKEGTIAENIAFGEEEDNFNFGLLKKAAHVAQLDNFIKQSPLGFQSIVGEEDNVKWWATSKNCNSTSYI